MSGAIYKAAAGALLQQMRLEMLSNNLANVNTVGFKADKPVFRVDAHNISRSPSSAGPKLSPYAPPLEYVTDFTTGVTRQTDNPLDAAIVGNGFFEVRAPDNLHYTRKGNFSINDQGLLSTTEGWPVMGQGGEITIEGGRIEINDMGEVYVDDNLVDTLRVVDFPQPYDLRKTGDAFFVPDSVDMRSAEAVDFRIAQGFIESSNVNAIRTMTEIIETLRVFESYQRVIRAVDDATAKTVNEVGTSV